MSSGTWLYYFNARWYDATLGRFVTEDPARDGINWFVYAYNNPLRWIDPTGLDNTLFTLFTTGDVSLSADEYPDLDLSKPSEIEMSEVPSDFSLIMEPGSTLTVAMEGYGDLNIANEKDTTVAMDMSGMLPEYFDFRHDQASRASDLYESASNRFNVAKEEALSAAITALPTAMYASLGADPNTLAQVSGEAFVDLEWYGQNLFEFYSDSYYLQKESKNIRSDLNFVMQDEYTSYHSERDK